MKILVINGPNLNMLGIREPNVYKSNTYFDLCNYLKVLGKTNKIKIKIIQSNYEGKIIEAIHKAYFKGIDGIVINPGAFTHYSYAIYDAIKSINIKCVEVHLSDIYNREEFRKISVLKDACIKSFYGKHFESYKEAVEYIIGAV